MTADDTFDRWLAALTVHEKAAMLVGADNWHTVGNDAAGIPSWRLSDGPNGVRGTIIGPSSEPAICIPCGSAIGATWDPELAAELGSLLARQARAKDARVLLSPTMNLHRSPLHGRTFESYSEDPLLAGRLAAGAIRGIQSGGVAACAKHYLGNEAETERQVSNSVIDERTLRELHLLPFEIAVREGRALSVMSSYNRVNGEWIGNSHHFLQQVLRDEWGFDGFVVCDWGAALDTKLAIEAGTDLVMPGPDRVFGPDLVKLVESGEVSESLLDAALRRQWGVFAALGALSDPTPSHEHATETAADRALVRRAAASAIVLLRNESLLPIDVSSTTSIAIIGPNSVATTIMGGGSAALRPFRRESVRDRMQARLGDRVKLTEAIGCRSQKIIPAGPADLVMDLFAGHNFEGPAVAQQRSKASMLFLGVQDGAGFGGPELDLVGLFGTRDGDQPEFSARGRFTYVAETSGVHQIGISAIGHCRVLVEGRELAGNFDIGFIRGAAFYGFGSAEEVGEVELTAGVPVEIVIEYVNRDYFDWNGRMIAAVTVGVQPKLGPTAIADAAATAAAADIAVVVVGTTAEWETEGVDRQSLKLPGQQDELVAAVIAANPRTVVVVNTGAPVELPWADDAAAILMTWFGGQELSDAIVDVLVGDCDPGGRLATTIPQRVEHTASYDNFPGDHLTVHYAEGVFLGYRWHDRRQIPPMFGFGHGLSYATFEYGTPRLSAASVSTESLEAGGTIEVMVPVTNVSGRAGTEVVQLYVAPPTSWVTRPVKELKGFAKMELAPGETREVSMTLDFRSFAHWNSPMPAEQIEAIPDFIRYGKSSDLEQREGWVVAPGSYQVLIARSAASIQQQLRVDLS